MSESVVIPDVCLICGTPDVDHSTDMSVIRHGQAELNDKMNNILELVQMIKDQVEPALNAVAEGPLGKMMGLK